MLTGYPCSKNPKNTELYLEVVVMVMLVVVPELSIGVSISPQASDTTAKHPPATTDSSVICELRPTGRMECSSGNMTNA